MASLILAAVAAVLIWYFGTMAHGYRKHIQSARSSGFKYAVAPVYAYNPLWMLTKSSLEPYIKMLPEWMWKEWWALADSDWMWNSLRKPFDDFQTEAILSVSPKQNVLFIADPDVIHYIASNREKFPKPTEDYSVLNSFGRNIVSTEGAEWKKHRRAMAPGFNESNNRLAFHQSIVQSQGMLWHWMKGGSKTSSKTIETLPDDTNRITLYIITAVGFGVRLLWPGETAKEDDSGLVTFSDEPEPGHTMSLAASIRTVLEHCFLIIILPLWVLRYGTETMRKAHEAYVNWKNYTEELLETKMQQHRAGEKVEGMDLMRLLVENADDPSITSSSENGISKRGTGLTKQEILGDTFVTILAGHETTANTIHFMLLHLAMAPSSQRHLQADVDSVFGSTPPEQWDYDTCVTPLLGNMVGATFAEMLRIMPPVFNIPKKASPEADQTIILDGTPRIIHAGTRVHLCNMGVHRSPKHWPSTGASKISDKADDLDDFVPERWLRQTKTSGGTEEKSEVDKEFGGFTGTDTSANLFKPYPGSYLPFSEGQRSCLGRRLAQVEMATVLAVVFQRYSVELAVDRWASDEEVEKMGGEERRELYRKAVTRARETVRTATNMLTLRLHGHKGGEKFVPVRIVKRGEERFLNLFE